MNHNLAFESIVKRTLARLALAVLMAASAIGAEQSAVFSVALSVTSSAPAGEPPLATVEKQFRELPMEAKRLTGPLFWLHGDESQERLEMYLDRVAESGNGCFTAESRPHQDWLGEGWYRDLNICLQAAKKHDLKMWIFDEQWWPSQGVGGKVPERYSAKRLAADAVAVEGPAAFRAEGHSGDRYIATLAGKLDADGKIVGDSIVDLHDFITAGTLSWQAPAGKWQVMKFTHTQAPGLGQNGQISVDGASRDCTEWFIQTVYQPHVDWPDVDADYRFETLAAKVADYQARGYPKHQLRRG